MMSVTEAVPGHTHFRCEDPFNVRARIQKGGGAGGPAKNSQKYRVS